MKMYSHSMKVFLILLLAPCLAISYYDYESLQYWDDCIHSSYMDYDIEWCECEDPWWQSGTSTCWMTCDCAQTTENQYFKMEPLYHMCGEFGWNWYGAESDVLCGYPYAKGCDQGYSRFKKNLGELGEPVADYVDISFRHISLCADQCDYDENCLAYHFVQRTDYAVMQEGWCRIIYDLESVNGGLSAGHEFAQDKDADVFCVKDSYDLTLAVSGLPEGQVTLTDTLSSQSISFDSSSSNSVLGEILFHENYNIVASDMNEGVECNIINGASHMPAFGTTVNVECGYASYDLNVEVAALPEGSVTVTSGESSLTFGTEGTVNFGALEFGSSYEVVATDSSAGVECTVINGSGTMPASAVTVAIQCGYMSHDLKAIVTGLPEGSVTLTNGEASQVVSSDGTVSLGLVEYTASYEIVASETNPGVECTVVNGSGSFPNEELTITVNCAYLSYEMIVEVSLPEGTVTLTNGEASQTLPAGDGTASFGLIEFGTSYDFVASDTNTGVECAVIDGSGIQGAEPTTVIVNCQLVSYELTVQVSLPEGSVTLTNGELSQTVTDGTSSFGLVQFGTTYDIVASNTNPGVECAVIDGSGIQGVEAITVDVNCQYISYELNVVVTGLPEGWITVQNGETSQTTPDGTVSLGQVEYGATYNVLVTDMNFGVECIVIDGSGTQGTEPITASVHCQYVTAMLSVSVSGLVGSVQIEDNQSNIQTVVSEDGTYELSSVTYGAAYDFVVVSQPEEQTCTLSPGMGTFGVQDLEIVVVCVTHTDVPSASPSAIPSHAPSAIPSHAPSSVPTASPSAFPSQSPVTPVIVEENIAEGSQDEESSELKFVLIVFGATAALALCFEVIRRKYFTMAKQVEEMDTERSISMKLDIDLEAGTTQRSIGGSMMSLTDDCVVEMSQMSPKE